MVDQNVFTDLRMVDARRADKLDVVGRIKSAEYDPVALVRFLVSSWIVNANLHIEAAVTGRHSTSEQGHWFSLHSDDPYWTNRENRASYDFGIHIARETA